MDWQTISLIVGIISALWALIFGQKTLLDLLKKPKGVPTQMNSLAIITLLALILLVSSATLYVLLAFRSSSAPPSSPTEPKTLTVKQQLLCMSNCDKTAIQIKVVSFTPYPTQNKTNMVLELNSQHDYSGCYFSDVRSSTAGCHIDCCVTGYCSKHFAQARSEEAAANGCWAAPKIRDILVITLSGMPAFLC